ncbi:unnamed protein product [Ectocarpus sp. CCAP 1310/34]|nr:unnamed protein product [Ectocarpus sp. CCAP 1310/34]
MEMERLPPPLWPACGVRSLAVWRSAWASRGLQHPGLNDVPGDDSTVEESLSDVVRRQRATIEALRLRLAAVGSGR